MAAGLHTIITVDPRETLWPEAALALAPLCGNLNAEDLLRPFRLM